MLGLSCFCNPPSFDMDCRIFNVRTWSFLCMRIHMGVVHTDSESAQCFWLGKTHSVFLVLLMTYTHGGCAHRQWVSTTFLTRTNPFRFSCAPDGTATQVMHGTCTWWVRCCTNWATPHNGTVFGNGGEKSSVMDSNETEMKYLVHFVCLFVTKCCCCS